MSRTLLGLFQASPATHARLLALFALSACTAMACFSSSQLSDDQPAGIEDEGDEGGAVPVAEAATVTVAPGPTVPASVDPKDLDREEVALLIDVLRESPAPCGGSPNLLDSLHQGGCALAQQLAAFAVNGIQKGYGKAQTTGRLAREARRLTAVVEVDTTGAPTIGPADAKIKVVLFSDFECPYCRKVVSPAKKLQKHYGIWLAFKHFPLRNHAFAEGAARASWAAQQQKKFWPMHDLLFEHHDKLDEESLKKYAAELGLDAKRFAKDWASEAAKRAVARDRQHGVAANIDGTPTFFVNGRQANTPEQVQAAIRKALKDSGALSIPAKVSF